MIAPRTIERTITLVVLLASYAIHISPHTKELREAGEVLEKAKIICKKKVRTILR